jgi:hypothetical protein
LLASLQNYFVTARFGSFALAAPIEGKKSRVVYRNVPTGHQRLIIKDGIATLSTSGFNEPLRFPASRWQSMRAFAIDSHGGTFYQLFMVDAIKAIRHQFTWHSIFSALLLGCTLLAVTSDINHLVHSNTYQALNAGKSTSLLLAQLEDKSATHRAKERLFASSPANATEQPLLTASDTDTAELSKAITTALSPRFPLPPLSIAPVLTNTSLTKAVQQQQLVAVANNKSGDANDGIDVVLGGQAKSKQVSFDSVSAPITQAGEDATFSLPKTPSSQSPTSEYRAITTNDGELVIQTSDGKFKQIHVGQSLPGGETLQSVDKSGASYLTSAGTKFLPHPKDKP